VLLLDLARESQVLGFGFGLCRRALRQLLDQFLALLFTLLGLGRVDGSMPCRCRLT
jgi:hypothetical protein